MWVDGPGKPPRDETKGAEDGGAIEAPNLPALPGESHQQYRRRTVLVRLAESRGKNITSPMSSLASLRSVMSSSRSFSGSSRGVFSVALLGASDPSGAAAPAAAPTALPAPPDEGVPLAARPHAPAVASAAIAEEGQASQAAPAAGGSVRRAAGHGLLAHAPPTAHAADGGDGMAGGALAGASPHEPSRARRKVAASTSRSLPFPTAHRAALPGQFATSRGVAQPAPQPTAATEGLTLLALCQYRQEGLVDVEEFELLKNQLFKNISLVEEHSADFAHTAAAAVPVGALSE